MAARGWIVPTSLLACMIVTRIVSGRSAAATSAGETSPSAPTGSRLTSNPSFSRKVQTLSTAGCSKAEVTMCRPRARRARALPMMAQLFASVPPLVKTTSSAVQFKRAAVRRRARFSACRGATA